MSSYSHSIMFHHFHDEVHPRGQGALSREEFSSVLDYLQQRYCLLDAGEYQRKAEMGALEKDDICLSFDDALLCQYDIALPELQRGGLKAFFFVYSSALKGQPDYLEVFRYFRTVAYSSVDDFYADFFRAAESAFPDLYQKAVDAFDPESYLAQFAFYTAGDRWFRYLRDVVLEKQRYERLMHDLMQQKSFDVGRAMGLLWMSESQVAALHDAGHVVGLHSYSHPTMIHTLTSEQQEQEYRANWEHLSELVGSPVTAMSHPCGNYNGATLALLRKLGIRIGFRSNMQRSDENSLLEIPREDHSNIHRLMQQ